MLNTKVQVTFSAPLLFLSSDQWTQIRTAILAQFPLKDVIWKSSSRPAVRTIQELQVDLVGLDTIRDEHTSQIPQTLLEKPFLNLYIVTCDDTDVYKNAVRKQIKDWHATVSQRKNQEWIILLVVRPDTRATAGGFFAMKSSVLDKIKADFNDKRDRCAQINWSQGAITSAACADLITKMKEGIMTAFDSAVAQRSEEVKRSESQRQMPGWNFCTFFILKESLASSFVGMSLADDAILTYSELEASFLQTQTSSLSGQKNISWFGKLINPDPEDDSLPLLNIDKKPYRDLILNNTISVFDFRVYLLAKHCEVLGLSGRVSEMAKKAAVFLSGFGQRLKECDVALPEFFVESWIFSAALNVVSQSDTWAELFELDAAAIAVFNACKGELLELARIQLDKIGLGVGHLPQTTPFTMSLSASAPPTSDPPSPSSSKQPQTGQITNADLLAGLADRDIFDKLYVETTNRAIDMYIKGGRRKFALKLHGSLAALDLCRQRHTQAHQTYSSLPAHYTPHNWTCLATFMQIRRLDTHAQLGKPHDREWIETVLAFFKGLVDDRLFTEMKLLGQYDLKEYTTSLLETLRQDADKLDEVIGVSEHPMFSVAFQQELAEHAEGQDGSFLEVIIRNALPCDVAVDNIRLFLKGRDSECLEFSALSLVLAPGSSKIRLFCPDPAYGLFIPDSSEISISSVKLQWNHQIPSRPAHHATEKRFPLVRILQNLGAVDVEIKPHRRIQLDAPQSLLVTLRSGRNRISKGIMKITGAVGIEFQTQKAEVVTADGASSVECTEDSLTVLDMSKESEIQVQVPHSYHSSPELLKVMVELEYHTLDAESSIVRHARFVRHVTTALPLMIQAHDHFRGKSLISKFTISALQGTNQHLRISSVKLESIEDEQGGLVVHGCRAAKRAIATVTPVQPAQYLFRIDSVAPRTAYASMHLHIAYRLLREEIEDYVAAHIAAALQSHSVSQHLSSVIKDHILKVLERDSSWVERYNATRELHLENVPKLPDTSDDDCMSMVLNTVVESLRENHLQVEDVWREVIVPVDLPFKNIVSSARIRLNTGKDDMQPSPPLYAGQPIAATLTIGSSFHWGGPGLQTGEAKRYSMHFDVKESPRDWLISGRKRGDFVSMDGSVHSVPLTLIPLRHGELTLPQVNVHPLPLTSGEVTMGSIALPSAETYQAHGAERVLILPRGGRTTFVVGMGD